MSSCRTRRYFVYLLTSPSQTLYVGVTNDLPRRMSQHKDGLTPGFASKYRVDKLVYYEEFDDVRNAIAREKQIKGMRRDRKMQLVESMNPQWNDLSDGE